MAQNKTVVFLCNCGANIANFVDLQAVADWAEELEDVLVVDRHSLILD